MCFENEPKYLWIRVEHNRALFHIRASKHNASRCQISSLVFARAYLIEHH